MSQIFKATYSNVPVYEMPCKGVAVMRRRSDAWLNATQILKVAGFDKPQRTRILEREVQKGTHEKVQGGYGKYQGTWVPMERGVALAQQYGVDHLLQPIIDYIPAADSPPQAPKHLTSASVSRPKKQKIDHDADAASSPSRQTARQSAAQARAASQAQAQAAAAQMQISHAAAAVPAQPRQSARSKADGAGRKHDKDHSYSPTPSDASSHTRTPSPLESGVSEYEPNGQTRKRKLGAEIPQAQMQAFHDDQHFSLVNGGPARYARLILDYFVSESAQIPQFLITPPNDFDANVVIDDDGHTALHWACAMGRIRIVRLLLTAGADIFRANTMGQTALMRSVMFTNNYDLRKFPELFELLHRSTINIDRNDRTVFHYVIDIALQKGKTNAARYYLETVLGRLAEYPREVSDILNFQDEEGETALTLAARARSRRLVKVLLDHGSDPKVPNKEGKTAEDYILEDEQFRQPDLHSSVFPNAGIAGPLHYSETGRHIVSQAVPQMSDMLEGLATCFDGELVERERDLQQANALLNGIQAQIIETQKTVNGFPANVGPSIDELQAREQALEAELKEKMGQRFRAGWDKFMREEEQRAASFQTNGIPLPADLAQIYSVPAGQEEIEKACDQARNMLNVLQEEKKDLFDEYVQIQAENGTGQKMAEYRKLVALGCGLPVDQVDNVIDGLAENLDADQ